MWPVLRAAAVVLLAACVSAQCRAPGERASGAPGRPPVEWYPGGCCDGGTPAARDGDWGQFCPGKTGGGDTGPGDGGKKTCYKDGERNQGAAGYPAVTYLRCCSGKQAVAKDDDWGLFCVGGGEPIKPPVKPPVKQDCYDAGERNQGAPGYPSVPYLRCCSGEQAVAKDNDWGFFCPDDGEPDTGVVKPGQSCNMPGEDLLAESGLCCSGEEPVPVPGRDLKVCPRVEPTVPTGGTPVGCENKAAELNGCKELVKVLAETGGSLDGFNFCSVSALEAELAACKLD